MLVDTRRVERRACRFESLREVLAEVERLASQPVQPLGNWSAGQIFLHLARTMDMSIDGRPPAPWIAKFVARVLIGRRKYLSGEMRPGARWPRPIEDLVPGETYTEAGLAAFRAALLRLEASQERAAHPSFGPMTRDEWDQFHLRHAELHLGFLKPLE